MQIGARMAFPPATKETGAEDAVNTQALWLDNRVQSPVTGAEKGEPECAVILTMNWKSVLCAMP